LLNCLIQTQGKGTRNACEELVKERKEWVKGYYVRKGKKAKISKKKKPDSGLGFLFPGNSGGLCSGVGVCYFLFSLNS